MHVKKSPPFVLKCVGWGTFPIEITITDNAGRAHRTTHMLSFEFADNNTRFDLQMDCADVVGDTRFGVIRQSVKMSLGRKNKASREIDAIEILVVAGAGYDAANGKYTKQKQKINRHPAWLCECSTEKTILCWCNNKHAWAIFSRKENDQVCLYACWDLDPKNPADSKWMVIDGTPPVPKISTAEISVPTEILVETGKSRETVTAFIAGLCERGASFKSIEAEVDAFVFE